MSLIKLNLPFCIGATQTPNNPGNLPSILDFQISVNSSTGCIQQKYSSITENYLLKSYELGLSIGTPSDDDQLGKPYVDDFIKYISRFDLTEKNILEIGCGTGYISRRLLDLGANVTSIEPGTGYKKSWRKYKLNVINDFFPTKKLSSKFDLVIFYTVFEHISDVESFLGEIRKCLSPGGHIILSVPDCSEELSIGDPSILMHEHIHYFNEHSLYLTLAANGFSAVVQKSNFGRSIYATAKSSDNQTLDKISIEQQSLVAKKFLDLMELRIHAYSSYLNDLLKKDSVGVYVPARALNYLPNAGGLRFFDDATYLKGKFFPPFCCPIEDKTQLLEDQPKTLFIASRTFGRKLKKELIDHGFKEKILTLAEIDNVLS